MRRNNEQAELLKRRTAETRGGVHGPAPALLRRRLRTASTLILALTALLGLALRAAGQEPKLVPQKVTIDVTKKPREPLQFRFPGKEPRAEMELEFKGDGNWSFVQFERLPEHVTLKVKGDHAGYQDSQRLNPGRWYPFKSRLTTVLDIKPEASPPVELSLLFGTPRESALQGREGNSNLSPSDARQLAEGNQVTSDSEKQSLKFSFQEILISSPADTHAELKQDVTVPSTSWVSYLMQEQPVLGIIFLIVAVAVLVLVLRSLWPRIKRRIRRWLERRRVSSPDVNQAHTSPLDDYGGGPNEQAKTVEVAPEPEPQGADYMSRQPSIITYNADDDPAAAEARRQARMPRLRRPEPGETVQPAARHPTHTAAPIGQDGQKFADLQRQISELKTTLDQRLDQKADRDEPLTRAAHATVNNMLVKTENSVLAQFDSRLKREIEEALRPVQQLISEFETSIKAELGNSAGRIKRVEGEEQKVKQHLGDMAKELGEVEKRLQARLAEFRAALDAQAVPDSFYAKTLGAVIGQNVEVLQDGNFERLMGERLNQFFQSGVTRGEGLQEVRERAEAVNAALKDVAAQMEKLDPRAAEDARPHFQRAAEVAAELGGLQTQLQNQRVTIETTLRIPVSTSSVARQSFLDELGRGIRRELDKLQDPRGYFEGNLNRLITTDLLAVVDICDKKVSHSPGARAEMESALKKLFVQADLRDILPRPGEPFKTAEHDLIDTAQGGPSLTVAQVITRGFYYKHRDNETLLRKAGVTVYR